MKTFILGMLLLAFVTAMAACNTVEGAGKDTKNAGQDIENAANNNK